MFNFSWFQFQFYGRQLAVVIYNNFSSLTANPLVAQTLRQGLYDIDLRSMYLEVSLVPSKAPVDGVETATQQQISSYHGISTNVA
jgi:hypothetical protein